MRDLARPLITLAVGLLAACAGPMPTPTPLPLPTDVPTPSVPMQQYAGGAFAIRYPADWTVDDAEEEVFFGPHRATRSLAMVVRPLGEVRRDTDALLDAYRRATRARAPDVAYSEDRAEAPRGGRSDFYQLEREGQPLQYRVTFFVQGGVGYRVLQWAPVADWDRRWSVLFETMLKGFEAR
jgi:hypothetical protein